jgi:hypothetical protein
MADEKRNINKGLKKRKENERISGTEEEENDEERMNETNE